MGVWEMTRQSVVTGGPSENNRKYLEVGFYSIDRT